MSIPRHGLVGVDGLEVEPSAPPFGAPSPTEPLRLSSEAADVVRREVERAGGREVCFLCAVDDHRRVVDARAVARGNREAVLAVARDAVHGGLMLHNHPSGLIEPSDADLSVAARVWEEGLGTAITDNAARELYVVVEPPTPRVVHPLDIDRMEALVGPDGPLASLHPGYEDREGQRRMLRIVSERYNEGGVAIVEAGTGTGKSLAYLLPAAVWARRNRRRTVVSTNTINLQAQLERKDLPLVGRLLGEDVGEEGGQSDTAGPVAPGLTWALMKGRGNYLSIRRAELALQSAPSLFEEDRAGELKAILEWSRTTEEGSLQELSFIPATETWEEVRSDPDICLRGNCPHFQRCFYQKSRRRASSADIVVVNHHLLFTDLAVRRATDNWSRSAVLPAYDHLVLDEAHNLEDAATSHLGVQVTRTGMMRLLSRLDRKGKGVLTAVQTALKGGGPRATELRIRIEERVRPALESTREAVLAFLDRVEPLVPAGSGDGVRIGEGPEDVPEPVSRRVVKDALDRLLGAMQDLEREIGYVRRRIDMEEELLERVEGRILDIQSAERRLGAQRYALGLVLSPSEEESTSYVRWLEVGGGRTKGNLVLAAAPIELGPLLRDSLFRQSESVVLTSATLATRSRFDFLRGRLGLDSEGLGRMESPPELVEEIVSSPFDFSRQVIFGVPTDLPAPGGRDGRFDEETARVTREVAEMTRGGLFTLFTSYRALRAVARRLREEGVDRRWPLFVHGEEDRARLLEDFVRAGDGILLGTSSFWEGVDVPGDPLRALVIQKLPFRVPTEPVTAARIEALEASGANAFAEYMLPLAALRLKQGFGRLIRSRDDRGAILLLDDRIVRKRYGRYLLDSLPATPLVRGPWREVRERLRDFYGGA